MAILISAFQINSKSGGGWVSKRIVERGKFSLISTRSESFLAKGLWTVIGILAFPFLHPIFSRYIPIIFNKKRGDDEIWLNFSQTFAFSLLNPNCVFVCHDLRCHCEHYFVPWLRWSERLLLKRAKKIVVLSNRDEKIVNRYYRVPLQKIENIGPFLLSGLRPFHREIRGASRSVAFLGSLARKENREGLAWFVQHVLPECPELEVVIIGQTSPQHTLNHPRLKWLGFVEDLNSIIEQQDLMIAPLFSKAGIKIKVVEALLAEIPVLGTSAAYGGLTRPEGRWSSDKAEDWITILNHGGDYKFTNL
jgi:hypothetical protein